MMTRFLFFALGLAILAGCAENIDSFTPDPLPPAGLEFDASAFVEVVDEFGNPLEGVTISLGTEQEYTDENGVVYLKDVRMGSSTYVTAEYPGYFHGSRRFYPSADKTHFVRIILLQDQIAGSFDASSGGIITMNGGVTLEFPASAIVDGNGNPYSGSVDVAAAPITADDPDLSYKMPGDLVGRNDQGVNGALGSLGMVAVELRSGSGQLLNVKEGSTVTMRMEVPDEFKESAPADIPMWYFDETIGLWIEDGSASYTGGEYVAEVGHFTYWNYDAWFPIVKWGATFVYDNGEPASQISVCITIIDLETSKCAWTNEDGVVCGMVAADELLLMEVVDQCGNVVYSEQIGPYSDTTMIGPITIPTTSVTLTTITGCVVNCDDLPVENGFVQVNTGGYNIYEALDDDGCFELTLINCNESDVTITALDEDALKQSLPLTFAFDENINAGTIMACEDLTEFITISVETFSEPYVWYFPIISVAPTSTEIWAQDSTSGNQFFFMGIPGDDTGTYEDVATEIGLPLPTNPMVFAWATDVDVVITYFGEEGDVVVGTFTGILNDGQGGQGGDEYPFTGSFSVLRD